MFPKMSPKQMKKMMQQIGMKMQELEAEEVIIRTESQEIIIENPSVIVVEAKNQKSYQISGKVTIKSVIPEEDVKLVAEQAKVSEEEARKALEKSKGDLAEAILFLTK